MCVRGERRSELSKKRGRKSNGSGDDKVLFKAGQFVHCLSHADSTRDHSQKTHFYTFFFSVL